MNNKDNNTHAENVGIEEILSDLSPATLQMVANNETLKHYYEASSIYCYLKPLLSIEHDITTNTAGMVAIELQDLDTCKTVSLACFELNTLKQPYLTETKPISSLQLGSNNPNGQCYAVNGSLEDGLELFLQTVMVDESDDTIHVIFHKFIQTVRKLAKTKQVIVFTTADNKHSLVKSLKGSNVKIYSTIRSAYLSLELGESLYDIIHDNNTEEINLLETVIPYENGLIESLDDGLYFITYDDNDEPLSTTFISSPLNVLARSRDLNSNSWGIFIKWCDLDGFEHRWAMPAQLIQGDSREYRKLLASQGLKISTLTKAQKALDAYLTNHPTQERAICVNQVGWHDNAYVLPDITINSGNQMIVYQPDKPIETIYNQQGTLEQWRNELCKPLAQQSRLVFAISCAFAGQLLEPLNSDSGGFHIVGGSSMGKSIGLKVAGSVWGNPDKYINRWRATDNGLESIASTHNDGFLGLDEISEGDPKAVGNSAYMLANGQGKVRAKAGGGNRPTASWRLMFLSNGEKTLNTYLKSANIEVNAGQLVRLIHIEADAGTGYRSFDSLVLAKTAEEQANIFKKLSNTYYGTAGMAWLEYITSHKHAVTLKAKELIAKFLDDYDGVKEQAYRVAERFAIVACAGEMATEVGITGWQAGQATLAVKSCFNNWLDNYGADGRHEERQIIKQVQSFIEQHGSSRFQPWQIPLYSDSESKIHNRAGWRKIESNLFLFYPSSFDEVCRSYEKKKVLQVLKKAGLLMTNETDRYTYKIELPDTRKRTRMYAITDNILNFEFGTDGVDGTT